MKTRYFFFLAAAALLAGCVKETAVPEVSNVKTYLTVGIAPETKTHLGEIEAGVRKVYWSKDDQIAVNGVASDKLSDLGENAESATFSFDGTLGTPYNVLYPASIYTDATHVTLPAVQTYKAGGFADGMFPMAGYSADGSSIRLSHLCAIVKIRVKRAVTDADEDNIIAVRFQGLNNEKVSGEIGISYSPTVALAAETGSTEAEKEVRVVKSQATSTETAVDYYLVIPARTYEHGFKIIVQDVNGHIMTKSKTNNDEPWTAVAGKLYVMPEFAFVPTGTELGIEISNAQQLIDFATAFNNKDYAELGSSLVATLKDDIAFTPEESADFNATKGIGLKISYYGDAEDYYFDGVFASEEGENYTISGLSATVPLFKATSSSAIIKDFTIDNTSSFTFTHSKAAELDAGAVVGYHRGTLNNVNVAADVSLAAVESVNKVTALGGLVGREVVGSVVDCSYSGNIVVPAGFQSSDQKIYIGGLVGEISNADGKVKDSSFSGTIDNQGQMVASSGTDDFKNNPQLMIGGIIGLNTGTIDNCTVANHATGVTVTLNDGSDHNYTGTVVTHSTSAYHYALAGIAGRNDGTVSNCINNANLLNIFSAARGSGDINGRYLEVGGVVGYNSASKTVSSCTNNGSIIDRATPKMQRIGGVVGWNYGTISSCSNSSTGAIGVGTAHLSPYSARQLYLGGVIGHNASGASVSNVQNAAGLTVSRLENNSAMTFIGGVIGQSDAAIDGEGSKLISNSGNIIQSYTCGTIPADGYNLGGIVGYAEEAAISNVNNTGNVQYTKSSGDTGDASAAGFNLGGVVGKTTAAISSSTNSGRVYMTNSTTGASTNGGYNLGGIAGLAGSTITGCSNSGKVDYTVSAAVAYTAGFNLGGIAGVNGGEVSNSTNSGEVYFANSSTGSAAGGYNVGGIVGAVNADVTDSDNTGYIHHAHTGAAVTTNIHIGGVAGYMASSAKISECDNNTSEAANSGTVYLALNTGYKHTENSISGILGCTPTAGVNATLEDCTNAGKVYGGVNSKQNGCPLYVGGIVAYLAGESSLVNCDNSGEIWNNQANNTSTAAGATYNGGVVAYAKGTSDGRISIKNCDNTSANMHSRRGILGGIVGYAEYADFTTCSFNQDIPNDGVNLSYWIGGIVSWADNCTLTSCTYSGAQLSGTQVQVNGVGGMAAQLTNSTIDGCSSSIETMQTQASGSWANVAGGAIVGVSGSGNTIQNCHYKPTINSAASNIAGTGSFTDGGGNLADL